MNVFKGNAASACAGTVIVVVDVLFASIRHPASTNESMYGDDVIALVAGIVVAGENDVTE